MGLTEIEKDEMDRKDSQIAALEREILLSKIKSGGASDDTMMTPGVNAVTVKLPDFYKKRSRDVVREGRVPVPNQEDSGRHH